VSFGVALCTLPLLAYSVHIVSPVMIVANLLCGPLVSVILVLALLTPLALIPGVDFALAWVLSSLGGLLELSAGLFAAVPGGHMYLPAPSLWWLVGYYATLALMILLPAWRLPRVSGALLWVLWLCLLPGRALVDSEPPGPATMTALDVGQGQCVVFEVPQGPCVVLDCGSTSLGNAGERVLAPYLWTRGRRQIDTLIVSHADADHVNGLPQLFERFAIGEVLIPETMTHDASGRALREWLEARANVRMLQRGERLELAPKLHLQCLWPDMAFVNALFNPANARNDGGLVLELQAGANRALLPSDVEHRGFVGIMPRYRTRGVEVLFAPHQGSAVTGLESILGALQPKHVLVSAREAFPAHESMELYGASGARVWRAWADGAVTFTLGADGSLVARGYLEP
jgi:competence protein ComEC